MTLLFGYPIEQSDDDIVSSPTLTFPMSTEQLESSVMQAIDMATYLGFFRIDHHINSETGDYFLHYTDRNNENKAITVLNLNGLSSDKLKLCIQIYPALKDAIRKIIDENT